MADRESDRYIVVARRYRPQDFAALVGQGPLVQTLRNAIDANRVGHAYLFTGSRGVGKTSAARIFAKCLNCEQGPTASPCNRCESCLAISTGDDVDVLEIDGASNRGIDEIRQLRANVGFRPSRSRYKIYIIDEVHMLSRDAFNALLKTLEEPPPHVKFIFCTTDADKLPVTVVSRCQRFDFAPITTAEITKRLSEIVAAEKVSVQPEALELLARRAEGSLRDSQSLLEQVMSSIEGTITLDAVHQLLGTAPQQHVALMMEALLHRDAKSALDAVDEAIRRGVDVGQLCEQLLTVMRDTMVVGVGCSSESLQSFRAEQYETLQTWAQQWGIPALLSALQILEQTLARMRGSVHRRSLLEVALVQIANLQSLTDVAALARHVGTAPGSSSPAIQPTTSDRPTEPKKKETIVVPDSVPSSSQLRLDPGPDSPVARDSVPSSDHSTSNPRLRLDPAVDSTVVRDTVPSTTNDATELWQCVVSAVTGVTGTLARRYQRVVFDGPDKLVVTFEEEFQREQCDRPERRDVLQRTLSQCSGMAMQLEMRGPECAKESETRTPVVSARAREAECLGHPLVKEAVELFEADITSVRVRP